VQELQILVDMLAEQRGEGGHAAGQRHEHVEQDVGTQHALRRPHIALEARAVHLNVPGQGAFVSDGLDSITIGQDLGISVGAQHALGGSHIALETRTVHLDVPE
jgi:hypothetical protein